VTLGMFCAARSKTKQLSVCFAGDVLLYCRDVGSALRWTVASSVLRVLCCIFSNMVPWTWASISNNNGGVNGNDETRHAGLAWQAWREAGSALAGWRRRLAGSGSVGQHALPIRVVLHLICYRVI
jgi:hypothetical protein